MPLRNIDHLAERLPDEFSKTLVSGAVAVLDSNNPIRAHLFAAALRELVGHLLQIMAPDEEVSEASWFKAEEDRPTRRQRMSFAIHGGLAEDIVKRVGMDASEFHTEMTRAIAELNKRTHVRPNTLLTEPVEIAAFAKQVVDAVLVFLDTINSLREALANAVANQASTTVFGKIIEQSVDEIDLLSTHSIVERVDVEDVSVVQIGARKITYRAEGTVYVELNYGSGSDRSRGEGATMTDDFPFSCTITGGVEDFQQIHDVSDLEVDTASWYE